MQVQLMIRRGIPVCKTVASFEEASRAVREFIGNRGASQCPRGMGLIADGGQIVARVSYNGCVWAGREWQSGDTPIYDPRINGEDRMSEHTPAPWFVARPSMGFTAIYGASGELVFGLAAGGADEKQPDDVCDANARLIAASPTMARYIKKRAVAGDAEAAAIWKSINR